MTSSLKVPATMKVSAEVCAMGMRFLFLVCHALHAADCPAPQ